MKHTIFVTLFFLNLVIPICAAQLNGHATMKQTGDELDVSAQVNVSGKVQGDVSIHLPAETDLKRLALELACVGYGIGLIASGTKAIINDSNKQTPSLIIASDLEAGLRRRASTVSSLQSTESLPSAPLLEDDENEENGDDNGKEKRSCWSRLKCAGKKDKKSCHSRLPTCSRGTKRIGAGLVFIGSSFSIEFLSRYFARLF